MFNPLMFFDMGRFSDLHVERQRAAVLAAAAVLADDVRDLGGLAACLVLAAGFLAALVCAVVGATLLAAYCFCFGWGVGLVVGLLAYAAAELVFIIKTWNV